MRRMSYSLKLFRELLQFSRENRVYWIVPIVLMLALAAVVVIGGEAVAPLLYLMF